MVDFSSRKQSENKNSYTNLYSFPHLYTGVVFPAVPGQNRYFRHESDPHRHSTRILFFGELGSPARLKLESILVLSVSTGSTGNKQESGWKSSYQTLKRNLT